MSEYVFKNMSEVEELAAPTKNTKVMGFENGEPVQMPVSAIGGAAVLISPNGTKYQLAVADDGTLSATAIETASEDATE